jgi:formiminotetrahydrofolate cyclodeaminase
MLTDASVRDLLAAFSSSDPTPGGGSAAALVSAIGVSLLRMVAALPKTRSGSDEDRSALQAAAPRLDDLRQQLTEAVDVDAAAYNRVIAAYRLPRAGDREQEARRAAIQEAIIGATRAPLTVMRLSSAALVTATTVAAHGNVAAVSDVGVAIGLLRAGMDGARLNVEANLQDVKDSRLAETIRTDLAALIAEGARAASAAAASLPRLASD